MIKDRLKAYEESHRRLLRKQQRLLELTSKLKQPGPVSHLNSPPGKHNYENMLPNEICELEELRGEVSQLLALDKMTRDDLQAIINRLPEYEAAVLEWRYLEAIDNWDVVARRIFGIREDFKVHIKYYVRRCQRLRYEALRHIESV